MYDSALTVKKIEALLREALAPSELQIEDQSQQHVGHRQAGGGGHFFVTICSERFVGLNPLARQRLVIDAVRELMDKEVHALSMKCLD